ncbi:GNAT family N-acetyltransferase [Alkalicoccobacillus murimartini]|uniref:GNAT superfamily N-acetyltransferase n=1 Tax=Alkalicoccobacillus murimartini TaxID=171685 RepID=A0ABT9YLJ4_9BACI|nr:GNAT family N-acetyltransferase [Alkalicoccobacillus murimartini]MDQ0208727.1 GNAT superfamily N-acetyltransferase [Alkalicoccobacillus murimartini]
MELTIKPVSDHELELFSSILIEAAEWLSDEDKKMWELQGLTIESILINYKINELFMAFSNGEAVGTIILQTEDLLFWPNETKNDAFYIHKLAVRRKFAGLGVSSGCLNWAKEKAIHENKSFLRLDCAADRPKLCFFYEKHGFKKKGRSMVGKYDTVFYEYKVNE